MNIGNRFDENKDMASERSPLAAVVEWFLSRVADRRQYRRRAGAFDLVWQPDKQTQREGRGTEISPNGLVFISPDRITAREVTVVATLGERKIPVRVKILRSDEVPHEGETWYRYVTEFCGIAAADWDAVVEYVNAAPEADDRRRYQNQQMTSRVDDAFPLLPPDVQERIVSVLVAERKLDPPKPGAAPLLKVFYGGLVKRPGKPPAHRINVHSRVTVDDEVLAYDSRFLVEEDGTITPQ